MARPKKTTLTATEPTKGTIYGYARVSTTDQAEKYGLDIQKGDLLKHGVLDDHIYSDVESGAIRDRPQLVKLLDTVKQGDTIIIPKLDRLARSTLHLLQIVEQLEQQGVMFKSINDPIDTTTPQGKMFFTIMGAVAEFERSVIKERTQKGIKKHIEEKGKASWGKKGVSPKKIETAKDLLLQGKTHAEVADILSMPKSTIYKHLPSNKLEQWRDEALAVKNKDNHDILEQ